MDRFSEFGSFKIHVTPHKIVIAKGRSEVSFEAKDVPKITSLLSAVTSAGDMLKHLPYVQNSPFRVIVKKEKLVLITKGMTKGGLVFELDDIDSLVVTLNTSLTIWTDVNSLDPSPKKPAALGWETPEVPIDGSV